MSGTSPKPPEVSDKEANKSLTQELNQLKQQLKSNLELVALRKFPDKIEQFKQLRKSLAAEIATVKGTELPCTIPVPDSLRENETKLQSKPDTVQSLVQLNPNLRCYQLSRHPVLLKTCQLPTNAAMVELMDKILPHLIELDQDLNMLDYALRLLLPRMREGEYLGTDLLLEVTHRVQELQGAVQNKIRRLNRYHYSRYQVLQSIISYGHLEDYRLKLARLDHKYCLEMTKSVDFMYKTVVVVHSLVKKNQDKLAEFKNMAEDHKEIDNFYC